MKEDRVQTVVFMRHGVALHNIIPDQANKQQPLRRRQADPSLTDPPLIEAGKVQAVQSGARVSAWFGHKIDVIVVSPLSRCIETAVCAFFPGSYEHCSTPIRLVCHEDVREAYGMHYSDKRREKSKLEIFWGRIVEFPETMSEQDEAWTPNHRETFHDLDRRISSFLEWLIVQPHQRVVVVSHGVWMECLLRRFAALPNGQRVYNTDAYAMNLHSVESKLTGVSHIEQIHSSIVNGV